MLYYLPQWCFLAFYPYCESGQNLEATLYVIDVVNYLL